MFEQQGEPLQALRGLSGTPVAIPAIAGAADTAIAQSGGAPALYASANTIYFARALSATPSLNGIYRYATGDTAPTLVVSADGVTNMIVDADTIYFLRQNTDNLFKAPRAGGTAVAVATASGYKLVALDASYVYLLPSGCCQSSLLKALK